MTIRETQIKITAIIRHLTDTRTAADRQTDRVHTEQGTQRTFSLRASSERKQSDIATLGFSLATVEKNSTNSPAKPSHRKNLPERKALSLIFIQLLTVKKPNSNACGMVCFVLFKNPRQTREEEISAEALPLSDWPMEQFLYCG